MSYVITLTIEVPADSIVDVVKAASRAADAVSEAYDDYDVTGIDFKKKHEIPQGYTHRGGGIDVIGGAQTVRTFNKDNPQENSHG